MHLHRFKITNIRAISSLEWKVPSQLVAAGWHVMIGDNGSGKSTVLRALALALIGPRNAEALRQDWNTWLAFSAASGSILLSLDQDLDDSWAGRGRRAKNPILEAEVRLTRKEANVEFKSVTREEQSADRHVWSDKPGWFSASFGPFRRFTGGNKDVEKLYYSHPHLARHLSVFGEDVALTECLSWLSQLRFEELDGNQRSGRLLMEIQDFINQEGFLPQGVKFAGVDSKYVRFVDGNGADVPVNALGDGFRSILSLTFELLRQMAVAWPDVRLFAHDNEDSTIVVDRSGVVMIDEIDAHLHPTWQRRIGFWLTRHFPHVQFLVTTHSPLVCHAAEHGSIFRLPTPGSGEEARMITGLEKERLIFGSVLDAYGTELFGSDVSRSETAKEKQQRLANLNQKALSAKLTSAEAKERTKLQSLFPASM